MAFRSRWLLLGLSLLSAALFVGLGFWQLSRLEHRREANRQALEGRSEPEIDLNAPAPSALTRTNHRISVSGVYDRANEIVLRGHVYREVPGVEIVTPLRITGSDSAVLVNRGFFPSPDATFAVTDSLNEPGQVQVKGLALDIPVSGDSGAPRVSNGRETWRRLDLGGLRKRLPYPLLEVYLLQTPDSSLPRYPRRLEPPELNDGPHLSYAIQWFAFATIAVVGGVIFAWRKGKVS
jgi:surfeit locus 1 family protein